MINLNSTPCNNCKHFCKIHQINKNEMHEYIECDVAKNKNAINLLYERKGQFHCNMFVEIE